MRFIQRIWLFFFLFTLDVFPSVSTGTIIRVPQDQPTIQAGIDTARTGDTVLVDTGTYVEAIDFKGKNITVGSLFLLSGSTSYISETVVSGESNPVRFTAGEDESCVLSGLTIKGNDGAISCSNYSSPTISHCILAENSTISHFDRGVIECHNSSPLIQFCTIVKNFEVPGQFGDGWSILARGSSSPKIINTTIAHNETFYGGGVGSPGTGMPVIVNSIIWDNPDQSRWSAVAGSTLTVFSDLQGGVDGEGNVDLDPLFVDPENGDFHLGRGSPAIDAATPFFVWEGDTLVNLPDTAYEGNGPDMGAYESPYSVGIAHEGAIPLEFALRQNYPNPFNPTTTIEFSVPQGGFVTLTIYDLLGREVETILSEQMDAGYHKVRWNAGNVPSGVYFVSIGAGDFFRTRKMVLLK